MSQDKEPHDKLKISYNLKGVLLKVVTNAYTESRWKSIMSSYIIISFVESHIFVSTKRIEESY